MELYTLALFGETEKGEYHKPYFCRSLEQLLQYFGNPPETAVGLYFAIQTILYQRNLIFFRVEEEGYSTDDYLIGIDLLKKKELLLPKMSAIYMPGVGEKRIIDAVKPIIESHKSFLIVNQKDFYDYLTES